MPIKVILSKAHCAQLEDEEIKKEVFSIEEEINKTKLRFQDKTVNYVFIKGNYLNREKKMFSTCLFVNKMDKPITELHGVLKLKYKDRKAQIAKTTIDFDKPFIGSINSNEALLVHLGIPIKGLFQDEVFKSSDIFGNFEDVRVTFDD